MGGWPLKWVRAKNFLRYGIVLRLFLHGCKIGASIAESMKT